MAAKESNKTLTIKITNIDISTSYKEVIEANEHNLEVNIDALNYKKAYELKLAEAVKTVEIKGFRPGKVPVSVVQSKYDANIKYDASEQIIDAFLKLYAKDMALATQPAITDLDIKDDTLSFKLKLELIPNIEFPDFAKISQEFPTYELDNKEVDEQLERIREQFTNYTEADAKHKAANGDRVELDFEGFIDGVAFPGGQANNHKLVLGSKSFIEGFEEQLIGVKAGDEKSVNVTFPEDYGSKDHAGKKAEFKVKIHKIEKGEKAELNDALAVSAGLTSLAELKEKISEKIKADYDQQVFLIKKKTLMDKLDDLIKVECPKSMIDSEYNTILEQEKKSHHHHEGHGSECEANMEEKSKELAVRRVKLGIFVAEYATKNSFQVSQQELTSKIVEMGQAYGERYIQFLFEHYTKNPKELANIRSSIIEDKVFADILTKISFVEKKYSAKELSKALQDL